MTPTKLSAGLIVALATGIVLNVTVHAQATVKFPDRTYDIRQFGAKMVAAKFLYDTVPIQKAIDTCAKDGGGTVVIPKGNWLTGPLFLRSAGQFAKCEPRVVVLPAANDLR